MENAKVEKLNVVLSGYDNAEKINAGEILLSKIDRSKTIERIIMKNQHTKNDEHPNPENDKCPNIELSIYEGVDKKGAPTNPIGIIGLRLEDVMYSLKGNNDNNREVYDVDILVYRISQQGIDAEHKNENRKSGFKDKFKELAKKIPHGLNDTVTEITDTSAQAKSNLYGSKFYTLEGCITRTNLGKMAIWHDEKTKICATENISLLLEREILGSYFTELIKYMQVCA